MRHRDGALVGGVRAHGLPRRMPRCFLIGNRVHVLTVRAREVYSAQTAGGGAWESEGGPAVRAAVSSSGMRGPSRYRSSRRRTAAAGGVERRAKVIGKGCRTERREDRKAQDTPWAPRLRRAEAYTVATRRTADAGGVYRSGRRGLGGSTDQHRCGRVGQSCSGTGLQDGRATSATAANPERRRALGSSGSPRESAGNARAFGPWLALQRGWRCVRWVAGGEPDARGRGTNEERRWVVVGLARSDVRGRRLREWRGRAFNG